MARTPKSWFYRQTGWWMCWPNGKKVKLAKGRGNKAEAEQRLLELRLEAAKNPPPDCVQQTVASVIETYLGFARSRLAAATLAMRWPYLQSFAESHGWRLVADCKPLHMETWLDDNTQWVSDWTKSTAVGAVQTCFNWAHKTRLTSENPFRGVTHHVGPPRRDMTEPEFRALLRCSVGAPRWRKPTPGARFRQVLLFLWYTGCRPKEACILQWSHVDLDQCVIVLPKHKTIRTQRNPRPRVIPLHPVVVRLLRAIGRRQEGDHVFLTHRKTPWSKGTLAQRVRRARRLAGIDEDVKLYGLRHAFGTRGVMRGCDLKTLSELMGHTSTRMTEHYAHLAGQRQHLAAAMRIVSDPSPGA